MCLDLLVAWGECLQINGALVLARNYMILSIDTCRNHNLMLMSFLLHNQKIILDVANGLNLSFFITCTNPSSIRSTTSHLAQTYVLAEYEYLMI